MPNHLGLPDEIFNDLPPQFQDPDLDTDGAGPYGGTMGDALRQAIENRTRPVEERPPAERPQAPAFTPGQVPEGIPEGSKFVPSGQNLAQQMDTIVRACMEEVNRVLQFHGCILEAAPKITPDGRVAADVIVRVATGPPRNPPR